jgi:hypothetical protein
MHTEAGEHASAARRLASIEAALAGLAGVDGEIGADNVYTAIWEYVGVPDSRWLQHHPLIVGAPEERGVS